MVCGVIKRKVELSRDAISHFELDRRGMRALQLHIRRVEGGDECMILKYMRACVIVRYLASTGLLAIFANTSLAGQQLRVAVQENSSPKYVVTSSNKGPIEGICPDLLRAIAQNDPHLQFVFETRPQPLRRIELRMEHAGLDANCLVDNAVRRQKFVVISHPLFSFSYHLIARADDQVDVAAWDDVRRLGDEGRILVVSGTGISDRLREVGGLHVEETGKSAAANLQKLVHGRGRFFYYRIHSFDNDMNEAMAHGRVRILPARMEEVRFHLMFGRHVDPTLVTRAERAIEALNANGTLTRLRTRWKLSDATFADPTVQRRPSLYEKRTSE